MLEGSRTVKSRDDNLWPLNGEPDSGIVGSRWNKGNEDGLTSYKRRRMENSAMSDKLVDTRGEKYMVNSSAESFIGVSTTMQNRSKFSYPCSNGFVSAAAQLQHVEKVFEKRNTLTDKKKDVTESVSRSQHGHVDFEISKTIKRSVGQGSLLSFWPTKTEINGHHGRTTSPQDLPLFEYGESKKNGKAPEEIGPKIPNMAAMGAALGKAHKSNPSVMNTPQELADHKLPSNTDSGRLSLRATERKNNPKQYVFLSSSPPPCEYPQQENTETSNDILPSIDDDRTFKSTSSDVGSTNDFRPTASHSTNLAQVRASSNLPKKTLGVRRSMAGWSSRGSQEFSVPRRATNARRNPVTCHSDVTG